MYNNNHTHFWNIYKGWVPWWILYILYMLIPSQLLCKVKFYVFNSWMEKIILTYIILTEVICPENAELELNPGLFDSKSMLLMCTKHDFFPQDSETCYKSNNFCWKLRCKNISVSLARIFFENKSYHSYLQIMYHWSPKILQLNIDSNLGMEAIVLFVEHFIINFFSNNANSYTQWYMLFNPSASPMIQFWGTL